MRYAASSTRPAIAAIAAVLALQTISASAQTTVAPPSPADPVTASTVVAPPVVAPVESAPTASPVTPQVIYQSNGPVVQPVPPVPAPVEAAAPSASATPRPKATPASPASSRAATPQTVAPVKAAPASRNIETISAAPVTGTGPATPADTTVMSAEESATPAVAPAQYDNGMKAGDWILGLGAALLLGAGIYATSRRKWVSVREAPPSETMYGYKPMNEQEREVAPFVAVNPADRFKTTTPELLLDHTDESVEAGEGVTAPAAFAPSETMRTASAASTISAGDLDLASRREAMIADAPSAENPFLTRKNRLRRANFLLAKEGEGVHRAAPQTLSAAVDAPAKAREPVQVSYTFAKGGLRPPVLKPRYN